MQASDSLTLAAARQIIFAAETKAYQLGCPCTISVVDINGRMIAHVRMDAAGPDRAVQFAREALDTLAHELSENHHNGSADRGATGVNFVLQPRKFHTVKGRPEGAIGIFKPPLSGVCIQSEGRLLGAIGVCSGTEGDDYIIAHTALSAYFSCSVDQ